VLTFHRENLREILSVGQITDEWRLEDVERTRFRLLLVLLARDKPQEAKQLRNSLDSKLVELRSSAQHRSILVEPAIDEFTDEDDMALLDANVVSWHGRTAGIWGSPQMW
jgi:hypothetical protein